MWQNHSFFFFWGGGIFCLIYIYISFGREFSVLFLDGIDKISETPQKKRNLFQIGVASLIWERTCLLVSLLFFVKPCKKTCCSLVTFQKNG